MTKKETFKWVVQIIASIATAILTAPYRFLSFIHSFLLNWRQASRLRPPFTFSNSIIVRARALISFCCFIIFKF